MKEAIKLLESITVFPENDKNGETCCGMTVSDYIKIDKALALLRDKLCEEEKLWKAIEDNTWDLRCIDEPTGGDDYNVAWIVIEHHMAEPKERQIGYGKTPLEAIAQAIKPCSACKYEPGCDFPEHGISKCSSFTPKTCQTCEGSGNVGGSGHENEKGEYIETETIPCPRGCKPKEPKPDAGEFMEELQGISRGMRKMEYPRLALLFADLRKWLNRASKESLPLASEGE